MSEDLITMVIALREAQKEFEERHTHQAMVDRIKYEMKIDKFIQQYMADQVQLEMWTRSVKGSESPGVYDVGDDGEKEQAFEE